MATFEEFMKVAEISIKDKTSHKRMNEIVRIMRQYKVLHGLTPEQAVEVLQALGPTYVKIGQLASNRSDLLPKAYCDAFEKLRDDANPMPFDVVIEQIDRAYGKSWHEVFASIDPVPLGAASIAQVHKATLLDGTTVAVKVRRPGVAESMAEDIMLMKHLLALGEFASNSHRSILLSLEGFVEEIERTTASEVNFTSELHNLMRFHDELADELIPYLLDMGYTHVELMPITEYPYDPSWGYQVTGYYAPTARYGSPQQFMTFVDKCHRAGIGVLLDWVPAHFPKDENGLYEFDGTCCYELSDPMMNEHPDWSTRIFDFGKGEVQSFLISNAVYWLEQYHVDGLRVDAVASMLYLDYGRRDFRPNKFGGRENLEAIAFLRKLNRAVFSVRRNAITAAEESTAFPMVTKPDYDGGLGFLFKWNMGWMNDMLQYMSLDPLWRKGSHNDLTFSMTYAYSENFILPLSHDEVVHGKGSLINKMPGEYDAKFQNLRAFYGFMMAHPGKKLSFMGNEFAQFIEWRHYEQLEWMLLDYDRHRQMHDWVRDLNHFYLDHSCMWNNDSDWNGFRWISADDNANSVVAFRRIDRRGRELICICNFCPVLREHYRLGLPKPGQYEPVLSSDDLKYGGSGTELLTVTAEREPMHGLQYSGEFTLAPLSAMFYQRKTTPRAKRKG